MPNWDNFFDHYQPSASYRDDAVSARACQLAATAGRLGTYAVGAMLINDKGDVVAEGHNEIFIGNFQSDLHAEMVVLNKFEAGNREQHKPADLTLVSSLEPCPMCMSRLIYAGVGIIRYVCDDPEAGMVTRISSLPPLVQQFSKDMSQVWERADCSPSAREAAFHIWQNSQAAANRKIIKNSRGRLENSGQ